MLRHRRPKPVHLTTVANRDLRESALSEVDGCDPAIAVPGQRIGTVLARSGELPVRFHPMIRPYHRFPGVRGSVAAAT
ncbi:MAG TPA: hypothetical protein VNO31_24440 [Umezawaea sp.]|nr:hypothetical protein [Umezawaea sp.]